MSTTLFVDARLVDRTHSVAVDHGGGELFQLVDQLCRIVLAGTFGVVSLWFLNAAG